MVFRPKDGDLGLDFPMIQMRRGWHKSWLFFALTLPSPLREVLGGPEDPIHRLLSMS